MDKFLLLLLDLKKKGFFHLIISNYSVQFIVFGSHLLVAKIMTPSDVGIILVFSFAVFIIFNVIAYFGLISQNKDLIFWFHLYSLIIIPSVVVMLLIRYYQAIDLFKRISGLILALKLVSAFFVLGLTYYFFIKGYVLSMVITTFIIMLIH